MGPRVCPLPLVAMLRDVRVLNAQTSFGGDPLMTVKVGINGFGRIGHHSLRPGLRGFRVNNSFVAANWDIVGSYE